MLFFLWKGRCPLISSFNVIQASLVFPVVTHGPNRVVLLGRVKKTSSSWLGRYNGFGGKFSAEDRKCPRRCALRELEEEAGICGIDSDLEFIGKFWTIAVTGDWVNRWEVSCFRLYDWSGEPYETREMSPSWFPLEAFEHGLPPFADRLVSPFLLTNLICGNDMVWGYFLKRFGEKMSRCRIGFGGLEPKVPPPWFRL